jgi:hypothetical protein
MVFGAREAGMRSNPPPGVWRVQRGRPPTAAQPEAEAETRPSGETHNRRGPAPHHSKPDVQEGAKSASEGLGVPVAFLSNRHEQARSEGENACTRKQRSEGPVTGRSGGTTDHAASATPGAAKSGSVTPSAARFLRAADGVERAGPGTRAASRASGERRTDEDRADGRMARDTRASRDSGEPFDTLKAGVGGYHRPSGHHMHDATTHHASESSDCRVSPSLAPSSHPQWHSRLTRSCRLISQVIAAQAHASASASIRCHLHGTRLPFDERRDRTCFRKAAEQADKDKHQPPTSGQGGPRDAEAKPKLPPGPEGFTGIERAPGGGPDPNPSA